MTTYKFEINFFTTNGGFLPLAGSVQALSQAEATAKARSLIEQYITAHGIIARCGTLSVKRVAKSSARSTRSTRAVRAA